MLKISAHQSLVRMYTLTEGKSIVLFWNKLFLMNQYWNQNYCVLITSHRKQFLPESGPQLNVPD